MKINAWKKLKYQALAGYDDCTKKPRQLSDDLLALRSFDNTFHYGQLPIAAVDASQPKPGETVSVQNAHPLLGHVVMQMGGPICWGCMQETKTMSLSSCEFKKYEQRGQVQVDNTKPPH